MNESPKRALSSSAAPSQPKAKLVLALLCALGSSCGEDSNKAAMASADARDDTQTEERAGGFSDGSITGGGGLGKDAETDRSDAGETDSGGLLTAAADGGLDGSNVSGDGGSGGSSSSADGGSSADYNALVCIRVPGRRRVAASSEPEPRWNQYPRGTGPHCV